MDPKVLEAVGLFLKDIKQGSLLTKGGDTQDFRRRKPFIGSDPVPVNQSRAPIPPSFRPDPVSPGQLNLFDVRANPSSSAPVVPNQNPNNSLARYGALERYGALAAQEPPGSLAITNQTPGGALSPTSRVQRIFLKDMPGNPPALTGGGSSPSIMDLLRNAAAVGTRGGAVGLANIAERSTPEPNYRNLGYASEADMRGRMGAQELLQSGRYVPGSQQQSIPKREGYNLDNVRKALDTKGNNSYRDVDYGPASRPLNDRAPLPQNNPPGNTMVPASNPFTKFFVDDANRLSPTARELATATGGVQTRDLGSLTSGLKAADLESLLNSVGSAQAMSNSPSFMAGNPLVGTPKLMLTGARDQAVNEQKQQYAKQSAPKGITDEQRDYVLTMQAQQEAGKVLLPEIIKNLGYSPQDPATSDLAAWAQQNPRLALALYNKQLESNLSNRSEFPSPAEIQPPDPVNQQSVGNVSDYMVNTPMGSNFSNNAIGNSHYSAEAQVTGSQTATELADATQALVQPTLQTEDQYTNQAPERMQATAEISNDMLRRAMELKMSKFGQPDLRYGN
jgi:hypothetical protein